MKSARSTRLFAILVFVTLLTAPFPAAAQEGPAPRCTLLGQMAVSHWLEMLAGLSDNQVTVDRALQRFDRLTGVYARLGCPLDPLQEALDCVLDNESAAGPRERAQACMIATGLAEE